MVGVLAKAGEDVTFIARGKQLAALNDFGLSIRSAIIAIPRSPFRLLTTQTRLG